ncbi:MAG: BamA/TamA family outer membrane protein [Verrucomicrobiota bacterium]
MSRLRHRPLPAPPPVPVSAIASGICLFISFPRSAAGEAPATPATTTGVPAGSSRPGWFHRHAPEFFDDRDGWFDLGKKLDHPFGFFPLIVPVTEPAVGYGAAMVPLFINQPQDPHARPDIWAAGAMATDNGSRAYFGGYSGYFDEDRWKITAGAASASINLDFHGLAGLTAPGGDPLRYNLEMKGGILGAERRIGKTPWRAGLRYLYGEVEPSLERSGDWRLVRDHDFEHRFGPFDLSDTVSSLQFSLSHDSRNNIFTPTEGLFSEIELTANIPALGASDEYQILSWTGIWYHPVVRDRLFFGWRADMVQSFGDVPFYRRPSVSLRGAPAQRYQGAGIASTEAELRWQIHPRWSLLGFAGTGVTWPGESLFQEPGSTATGGLGFRYLIARRQGIHFGIDAAYGEEGTAFYVQFGSGWFRP